MPGLLIWLSRRFRNVLRRGDLFFIYLVFYSFGRFFLEFLRLDPSPVAGINVNQTIMAIVFVASTAALILRRRFLPNEPTAMPTPVENSHGEDAPAGKFTAIIQKQEARYATGPFSSWRK